MRPSAICSEPIPRAGIASAAAALVLLGTVAAAPAQVRMTQPEALASVFPDTSRMDRRTAYLSEDQVERARELAGPSTEVDAPVVTYYVGPDGDGGRVAAYFDVHRVRTHPEVLMIVVGEDAAVRRVEVLKFEEPREYLPPEGWLGQFPGRRLTGGLSTRGEIAGITGATLTARAVTRAVRRTLALHRVISPFPGGEGS